MRVSATARGFPLAEIGVSASQLAGQRGKIGGQLLDSLAVLLAGAAQVVKTVQQIGMGLGDVLHGVAHLAELFTVRFTAFADNPHDAPEPLLTFIAALLSQFDNFCLNGIGEQRGFTLLIVEGHNLLTLLRGKFQALSAEAGRGIGHRQPHDIRLAVKRKLRMQFNAGVNFLTFFRQLLHALRRFNLGVKRSASGKRAFADIFRTQRRHIPHRAEITAGERRKIVLHVDACAVHVGAVVCCCITKVLRANFTPVNGGTGDSNAEFLTGWFSCASHVDNPVEWFLYGHDGRA